MSHNQSRADKSDVQLRKPGRSGISGHQRGFTGGGGKGGGGGGSAPPAQPSPSSSSVPSHPVSHPPLSTNRSFKKPGNGQGGYSRVNPSNSSSESGAVVPAAATHAVQNGGQCHNSSHGPPIVLAPTGSRPDDSSVSKNPRTLPRPPPSQSSAGASDPTKGDTSKTFTLQFGSINPGFVNGMQIPARTSSAPPNLDEQKRDQARHNSFRAVPTLPISSAPNQQHQPPRKDMFGNSQFNTGDSHPPAQAKRDIPIPMPTAPTVTAQKSPVLPMTGMSMSMLFQQPQVPIQFGGPTPHMQSQGVTGSPLQLSMSLPVGNAQQVQQQMFVPSLQSHPLPQGMLHQGQGLSFAQQMGHQLAPQGGDLGMGIPPAFAQQQTGKFVGSRKPSVKITHPVTHEELRLDERTDSYLDAASSGPRPHPNVPSQSQPAYGSGHQMTYYSTLQPNSYNTGTFFLQTPASLPLTSTQFTSGTQPTRYNYPVGQSGSAVSYINPLPSSKVSSQVHSVSESVNLVHSHDSHASASAPSAPIQVTVKPAVGSFAEKAGIPPVTISMPSSKEEAPKLLKLPGEGTIAQQQRSDHKSTPESSIPKSAPGSSSITSLQAADSHSTTIFSAGSTQRMQLGVSPSTPAASAVNSVPIISSMDDGTREPLKRSDSLKDHPKKPHKNDLRHSQQQHQADASDSEAGSKLQLLKISKEICSSDLNVRQISKDSEDIQAHSGASEASTLTSGLLTLSVEHDISSEIQVFESEEGKTIPSSLDSSGVTLEKEASQDIPLDISYASEMATGVVPPEVRGLPETSISGVEADGTVSQKLDTTACPNQDDHTPFLNQDDLTPSVVETTQEIVGAEEHGKTEACDEFSQDDSNLKVHPESTTSESYEGVQKTEALQEVAVDDNFGKVTLTESAHTEKGQRGANEEAVGNISEANRRVEKSVPDGSKFVDFAGVEAIPSSDLPSGVCHDNKTQPSDGLKTKNEGLTTQEVDVKDFGVSSEEAEPSPDTSSEMTQKPEEKVTEINSGDIASTSFVCLKDRSSLEVTRTKSVAAKKKKKKEMLSKADAAGINSDLYMAYKGPEEKREPAITSESVDSSSTVNVKQAPTDDIEKDVMSSGGDGQSKAELDNWEDAADLSTPKLRTSENGQVGYMNKKLDDEYGNGAVSKKKYSRDFLLTFREQCTALPADSGSGDIADALMSFGIGTPHISDREPFPSPGRIIDRPSGAIRDRRVVGIVDDDKWTKAPGPFGPGRDLRVEVGPGAMVGSFRPGQGVNHGVLRNPRGQSNTYAGGILFGPMQSMASPGGIPRSSVDADRWQRGTGIQRGLIPSPQTPLQVMHKAEKKYEIGKVSDKEEANQRQLKAILNKLTPQNFERLFEQVKEVNIDNTVTLTGVISQIFDKALMEPTFCEMYANFCYHLAGALPDFTEDNEKVTFKRLLLNKCQEEFERGEREQDEANRAEEGEIKQSPEERERKKVKARRRMLGNIRLIGELYKKRMLTERIMHECIKKLLGQYQNPDEEDIEALCKLMSTIGEMIDHPKAKVHMDAYFDLMTKQSANQKLSSRVRFMLRDAIDLRKNRWQQRRKVEGPKKIEEVHRDAAQERQAQASRSARGPSISSSARRGPPVDYGPRGTLLPSPSSQTIGALRNFPPQGRGFGTQDVRLESRHSLESRMLSVPLPQRPIDDDSLTLGPQGGLARGMSIRGGPLMPTASLADMPPSTGDSRRVVSGPNGYSSLPDRSPYISREEPVPDRFAPHDQILGNRDLRNSDRGLDRSFANAPPAGRLQESSIVSQNASSEMSPLSEEHLREKSISTIREFYSAKDEKEVALCVKELNSPSFYPAMVSLWVTDSFEMKDIDRDLLAKLLVTLCKPQESFLSQVQLIQGFESVLSTLEDAVNDAPRAAEFLGRIFAEVILENVVDLKEIGRLILEGGEDPGGLLKIGLASEVLGSILEIIKIEKGDSVLNKICSSSNLQLEDFRPPHPIKSRKLDPFL